MNNRCYPADLSKRDQVKMKRSMTKKMSECAGSIITPEKWLMYEEMAEDGEPEQVLVIEAAGEMFGTISKTFIREFTALVDEMGEDLGDIKIITGTSKKGRDYVSCELA